jgi:hypothetical protein
MVNLSTVVLANLLWHSNSLRSACFYLTFDCYLYMPMETNTKNPDAESSNAKKCPLFFKQKF